MRNEYALSFKLKNVLNIQYLDDIKRIQKVMCHNGYEITLLQVEELWEKLSNRFACGWRILPENDLELYQLILEFLVVTDNI
jgi:hypothetical protein